MTKLTTKGQVTITEAVTRPSPCLQPGSSVEVRIGGRRTGFSLKTRQPAPETQICAAYAGAPSSA